MSGGGGVLDWQCPFSAGARSVEQFQRPVTKEAQRLEIIRMALVRVPQCGQAPSISHLGIEADGVGFQRQTGGVAENRDRAVEIVLERFLEWRAPARR